MMRTFGVSLRSGLALVALTLTSAAALLAAEPASPVGKQMPEFALRDFRGKEWAWRDFQNSKFVVVAFLGCECPIARLYAGRLGELEKTYAERGVRVVGIDSNQQDSLAELAAFAKDFTLEFPLLKDAGNRVADQFGAQRTPEVFVLDATRKVRYWGAIDDQYGYGVHRVKPEKEFLKPALDDLLAGREPRLASSPPKGCFIGRLLEPDPQAEVTYTRHVARILNGHCVECHRPGEIGPFSLLTYADAVGWAEMIAEVTREERMPPWHADPRYGHFQNDIRLTAEEKDLLQRWVDGGAPEGNPQDLPPAPKFVEGWRIGQPDLVVYMDDKAFHVPASGEVRYQYFTVDPGFKEDKWIKAAECRPGNRAVVHHIIVGIAPPGGHAERLSRSGLQSDWLTATAPGAMPLILAPGYAKLVPKGSRLVFQMHYTPNGTATTDRSSVGLIFADPKDVKHEVVTRKAQNRGLVIPAGHENFRVEATYTATRDQSMLAMFPHMHLRGKAFRYTAIYPDGRQEILLDVPRYDFNWQNSYIFTEPKPLPRGTKIHCVAHFDNSRDNPHNPDATATVRWGDQTWEEMMIGYFDVALDAAADTAPPRSVRTEKYLGDLQAGKVAVTAAIHRLARRALQSELAMAEFGLALKGYAPQLDRACLTVVEEGRLSVERCVQAPLLALQVGTSGLKVSARNKALPQIAAGGKPLVYADLATQNAEDLEFMARAFSSSMHIPVTWNGKPATINFWSAEANAFPPELRQALEELAKEMAAGEK